MSYRGDEAESYRAHLLLLAGAIHGAVGSHPDLQRLADLADGALRCIVAHMDDEERADFHYDPNGGQVTVVK